MSPLVMRGDKCNQVAIASRGDGDERLMEVWGSQSEENCQEGLAGLGWRGGRVPSSARANHQTERILLDQSLPSNSTRQQPKNERRCKSSKDHTNNKHLSQPFSLIGFQSINTLLQYPNFWGVVSPAINSTSPIQTILPDFGLCAGFPGNPGEMSQSSRFGCPAAALT